MSRIGKLPIKIPATVDINVTNDNVIVKGKFGTLERTIPEIIRIEQTDGTLIVGLKNELIYGIIISVLIIPAYIMSKKIYITYIETISIIDPPDPLLPPNDANPGPDLNSLTLTLAQLKL